jgi:methionyl aminopeptidase
MIVYLKSEEEQNGFREAGRIAAIVLRSLLNEVRPGISTSYLDNLAKLECKALEVNPIFLGYRGFPAAICTSINNVLVHGIPNDELLKEGDILTIDVGIEKNGFIGDTAETILVGEPLKFTTTGEADNFEITLEPEIIKHCKYALDSAIAVAKEGNKLSRISFNIQNIAKKFNYGIPKEYGGHGISRNLLHSEPFIPNIPDYKNDITLRAGMILAIEPMFILGNGNTKVLNDGWTVQSDGLSVHCEHTVLITKDGPEILTEKSYED